MFHQALATHFAHYRGLIGFTIATVALFGLTYPAHFLIADEVAYFEQALQWAGYVRPNDRSLPAVVSDYPPGTALLTAVWVALLGPKAVFWSGIGAWLIGIWALALLLRRLGKPIVWALYPALFLPGIVLTRTGMSDLPSFALSSIFLWLYANQSSSQPIHRSAAFASGLVAGLALLFRETNVLWALPFLATAALRRQAFWQPLWLGFGVGLMPRLLWGWLFFGDPLFVRESGVAFSVAFLPQNVAFYAAALVVLAPGGLYFLAKNRSPYRWEMLAVGVLFLAVYGCYGYDAFAKSGYKAVVLQGRYLLPVLPMLAVAAAHTVPAVGRRHLAGLMGIAALGLFAAVQIVGKGYNADQQRLTDALLQLPTQTHLTGTPDESRKYLNALHGPQILINLTEGIQSDKPPNARATPYPLRISAAPLCHERCYSHLITRTDSADWEKKNAEAEATFERYFRGWKTVLIQDLTIRDGTRLRVWHVQNTMQ